MKYAVIPAIAVPLLVALTLPACGGGSGTSPTTPSSSSPPTASPSACAVIGGSSLPSLAILYGSVCTAPSSPVVYVNLYDQSGSRYAMCSGTVIARRAVLTAAHCLASPTASTSVFLPTGETVAGASYASYPGYRSGDSSTLDIGVILTGQDLSPGPVPLLTSRDAKIGEQAVIAGWGQGETGSSGTLRAATTTVAGVSSTTLQISSAGTASGVCYGDSGGPLLLSEGGVWAVAGVTSAFTGNSCSGAASSFTAMRNAQANGFVVTLVPDAVRK